MSYRNSVNKRKGMVEQFIFWLIGLVEDDPIPDEIKCILFETKINGKYKYIQLKGYEDEPNVNSLAFCPLEAQWFNNITLAKMYKDNFIYNVKYIINESISNDSLKEIFMNKKIYFKYLNNMEFLFKVNID